jgi:hypothetical protein
VLLQCSSLPRFFPHPVAACHFSLDPNAASLVPAQMRAFFEGLGWHQTGGETARSCGQAVVGPHRKLSFDDSVKGTGHSYMFWIAHNVRAGP